MMMIANTKPSGNPNKKVKAKISKAKISPSNAMLDTDLLSTLELEQPSEHSQMNTPSLGFRNVQEIKCGNSMHGNFVHTTIGRNRYLDIKAKPAERPCRIAKRRRIDGLKAEFWSPHVPTQKDIRAFEKRNKRKYVPRDYTSEDRNDSVRPSRPRVRQKPSTPDVKGPSKNPDISENIALPIENPDTPIPSVTPASHKFTVEEFNKLFKKNKNNPKQQEKKKKNKPCSNPKVQDASGNVEKPKRSKCFAAFYDKGNQKKKPKTPISSPRNTPHTTPVKTPRRSPRWSTPVKSSNLAGINSPPSFRRSQSKSPERRCDNEIEIQGRPFQHLKNSRKRSCTPIGSPTLMGSRRAPLDPLDIEILGDHVD